MTVLLSEREAAAIAFGPDTPKRKKPRSGKTAIKHARSICAVRYPGQPIIEAYKRMYLVKGNECGACGRGLDPRSSQEDIWGVFDIVVVGFGIKGACIQVTTQTDARSSVAQRQRKIEGWLRETPPALRDFNLSPNIEIWSWVDRTHMRRWMWSAIDVPGMPDGAWDELEPMLSPAMKRRGG